MSQEEYEQVIDTVGSAYAQVKEASKVDISGFKKEMKEYWNKIEKTAAPKKKVAKKAAPVAKKAVASVKKVAKKVTPAVKKD